MGGGALHIWRGEQLVSCEVSISSTPPARPAPPATDSRSAKPQLGVSHLMTAPPPPPARRPRLNTTICRTSSQGGGGGGAIHSLGVCTNCETTAPSFWQWTSPRFSMSKFTASSFPRNPRKPLLNQHLLNNFFVLLHLILLMCSIGRH